MVSRLIIDFKLPIDLIRFAITKSMKLPVLYRSGRIFPQKCYDGRLSHCQYDQYWLDHPRSYHRLVSNCEYSIINGINIGGFFI